MSKFIWKRWWDPLAYQIYGCIEKFLQRSVGTADKYVITTETEAAFPELTICPAKPYHGWVLISMLF